MKGSAMNLGAALRIRWAVVRYDFWLDLHGVRRRDRRALRTELRGNLTEAAQHVGVGRALDGIGPVRRLAAETSTTGIRSSWSAGAVVASSVLAVMLVAFFAASLYFVEGALDAGAEQPVSSGLFPFLGSSVKVHDQGDAGLTVTMFPGPLVAVVPVLAFIAVARPWRAVLARRGAPVSIDER